MDQEWIPQNGMVCTENGPVNLWSPVASWLAIASKYELYTVYIIYTVYISNRSPSYETNLPTVLGPFLHCCRIWSGRRVVCRQWMTGQPRWSSRGRWCSVALKGQCKTWARCKTDTWMVLTTFARCPLWPKRPCCIPSEWGPSGAHGSWICLKMLRTSQDLV